LAGRAGAANLYLIALLLLLLLVAAMPLRARRWPIWVQVAVRMVTLAVATVLLQRSMVSPIEPHFSLSSPALRFWQRLAEAGWWVIAGRAAVGVVRLLVVLENRPRETRIISDLLAGAIYVVAVLAIVNFSFDVPIRSLLATSGVIAIVIGLALQSTLSDVFSGIAVGLERPYRPGDLLWVEGNIEGRVVHLNWRSTHIATAHDNIAVVPNSIIAKSRMINRSAPTPIRGDTLTVELDPAVPPELGLSVLEAAVRSCGGLLASPAPSILCSGLSGDGVSYEIAFYVASSAELAGVRSDLYGKIHRHLRFAGIGLAVKGMAPLPRPEPPTPELVLGQSDLFGILDEPARRLLAGHLGEQVLDTGEVLIRQGEHWNALYVIAAGAAEILRGEGAAESVIYRMSPGESLGVIGLTYGTPSAVTVRALTPLRVWRLDKTDLDEATRTRPELRQALLLVAERGRALLARRQGGEDGRAPDKPGVFLVRLRNVLHLLAS